MVSGQDGAAGPPPGAVPVVMPTDVILARAAVLVVWAGAVTVYPEGFAFTLRVLSDTRTGPPPAPWALEAAERDRMTWLKIRYADGRARAADLNSNTPPRQLRGPHLRLLYASDSDGCADSRWWVTPLPPPGPVELTIHLNGQKAPAGVGRLDGAALLGAAARAETVWPAPPAAPGLA